MRDPRRLLRPGTRADCPVRRRAPRPDWAPRHDWAPRPPDRPVVRLVLLVTSPRVAPGALTFEAWQALREGVFFTRDQAHPQRPALAAAGIVTEALDPQHPPAAIARILRSAAEQQGCAVWLAGATGDDDIGRALADMALRHGEIGHGDTGDPVEIEVVHGSWDLPGARLLDVVTTMDRLRSPGGCPWDAQQTHD